MKIKFLLLLILVFYVWTATAGTYKFQYLDYDSSHSRYYNILTDAFLKCQLNLPVEPSQELLALPDPYEPSANSPYKLHDCSLYKGKYFLYFGPTPVIALYFPYRILTGLRLPDNIAVLVFMFGTLIWSAALLSYLRNKYFKQISDWKLLLAVAVVGVANFGPFILQRTEVYEVAISCGIFFLTGAIYFLCRGLYEAKNMWMLGLGSLFLGMAAGGRPQILLSAILIPLIIFFKIKGNLEFNKKDQISLILTLVVPYLICLLLLASYNYFRFDNPFEFGNTFQLGIANLPKLKFSYFENILSGIYFFILRTPVINSTFPFIHVEGVPVPADIRIPRVYLVELIVGIFPGVPLLFLLFICPIIYWIQKWKNCKTFCLKNSIVLSSIIWAAVLPVCLSFFSLVLHSIIDSKYINSFLVLVDGIIGYTVSLPYCLFILSILIIHWIVRMPSKCDVLCQRQGSFPKTEFLIALIPGLINLTVLLALPFVTMRYLTDFATLFILLACIIWFYFDFQFVTDLKNKKILTAISVALAFYSIFGGYAYSIQGVYGGIKATNPAEFYKIESYFNPLASLIHEIAPLWGQY